MGTYLSTPITEKCEESGESLDCPDVPCAWGVVDMQGWRKTMEDAHTAVTDIPLPQKQPQNVQEESTVAPTLEKSTASSSDAKVFGVFDGHGGSEVARFCSLYLVSVLQQQPAWTDENIPTTADSPLLPSPDDSEAAAETPVGKALRSTFHALDRMIDDVSRRQELMYLSNSKPFVGERREAVNIPPIKDISNIPPPDFYTVGLQITNVATDTTDGAATICDAGLESESSAQLSSSEPNSAGEHNDGLNKIDGDDSPSEQSPTGKNEAVADSDENVSNQSESDEEEEDDPTAESGSRGDGETEGQELDDSKESPSSNNDDSDQGDDDSLEVVGKEDVAENDQNLMNDDDYDEKNETQDQESPVDGSPNTSKVSTMFQKILSLGSTASSGRVIINVDDFNSDGQSGQVVEKATTGPNARNPTVIHQGRMICNLPNHPIHAGATAIVAVITGRVLTVANAGDSRAVLCRADGVTYPLSFDHKPQQDREMTRITRAGGFVNHFGRVNGNLNLSRSIGDLKYKQVPGIPPADQMITAEPDIVQIALEADDEFIILGCDGIWDCLSNENAVQYVRERIDTKTPTEIGREMLDEIISDDPRMSQGIGGDNMTIMIIDLRPSTRSLRKNNVSSSEEESPE